jgi:hypothetical protein
VPMAATLEIPQMLQLQEGMMNGLSVVGVEACARGEMGEEAARLSTSQKPRPFGNVRHRYFTLSRALTPNSWSIHEVISPKRFMTSVGTDRAAKNWSPKKSSVSHR